MLSRTTDMPASARRKKDSRSHEVGPIVHTTLVFLQAAAPGPRRQRGGACVLLPPAQRVRVQSLCSSRHACVPHAHRPQRWMPSPQLLLHPPAGRPRCLPGGRVFGKVFKNRGTDVCFCQQVLVGETHASLGTAKRQCPRRRKPACKVNQAAQVSTLACRPCNYSGIGCVITLN